MDLSAFLDKLFEEQDSDVLREGIRVFSHALRDTEIAGLLGADRHGRTPDGWATVVAAGCGRGKRGGHE